MPLILATGGGPAAEPLSTAEVKTHLRVTGSDDDTYIGNLVKAFRTWVDGKDGWLNRALINQTWDLWLDRFPCSSRTPILIPLSPLSSVTHVKYYDAENTLQTWSSSEYFVDSVSEPARLYPAYNESWPTALDRPNAVNVKFVAGYGSSAAAVPEAIRHAGLLMIGHWYENREEVNVGNIVNEMPFAAKCLLAPYKVRLEQGE